MIRLPPLYLRYEAGREHAFARRLREFADGAEKGAVAILHAPTGAGKTRALVPIAEGQNGVLLTVPTNALAAEVEQDYSRHHDGRVARWNAEAFTRTGISRHEEMITQAMNMDLVVSNPDILHLFTQHEYLRRGFATRPSNFGMKNLGLLVFDEYHAYDERVLASILLHILKSRAQHNHRQRFVFMSATPDTGLNACLARLEIPFADIAADALSPKPMTETEGRLVKGEIEFEITSLPISTSVPSEIPLGRTLIIFSTFLEQQNAVRRLQKAGIPEMDQADGFVQITGRKTRSVQGQSTWDNARVLLATSKVEVGLNILDLDHVIMEPGWSEQQFWQRFGRAARGRPTKVTLHFTDYPDPVLANLRAAQDLEDIAREINSLLRSDRRHVDTVLRFVGAYAAAYKSNPSPSIDRMNLTSEAFPATANSGFGLVAKMHATWENDELRNDNYGAGDWMKIIRRALTGLRGSALQARTHYAWNHDDEIGLENVLYLICRTDAKKPDPEGVYRVNEIYSHVQDATLEYRILDESIFVPVRGSLRRNEFQRVPDAIATCVRRELSHELPPFWDALTRWLTLVPPDEIPPQEVVPDDTFL